MAFSLKSLLSTPASIAENVGGHLILSLPNAIEPKVWRVALDKIDTAAFEIKQEKNSENAKLILKPKKGTAEIIANFETKKEAVEALMAASKALSTVTSVETIAHTKAAKEKTAPAKQTNYTDAAPVPQVKNTESKKWGIALVAAILVIGLYMYLTSLIPERVIGFETTTTANPVTSSPQQTTGVPVSADDFLGGL